MNYTAAYNMIDKEAQNLIGLADKIWEYPETAYNEVTLKFIPYFAFANRGESDMLVWVRRK